MADPRCVHEVFEKQAEQTPRALALVSGAERLTYAELDARADRLARRLVDAGVRRGSITGVHLARGTDMVTAILATLKAGAGYLMLDPEFPGPRLTEMMRDAAPAAVIGRVQLAGSNAPLVQPDDDGGAPLPPGAGGARPGDVACVMFTSGSTGRPKGVATAHHSITGSLCGQRYLSFGPGAVWLQCAPVSWDMFALELWGALLFGGTCVLHPGQRPDPVVISRLVPEHAITTAFLSSSLFNVMVDEYPAALAGLREVMVAGEAPSAAHLARALARYPGLRLTNGYGPVENMIVVSAQAVTADAAAAGSVPIGRPLAGKRLHVLDERLRPVADGQTGELYASGEGLAYGYLGQPGLTATRFVACPSGLSGELMYRTGDVVRWHADAPADYLGRQDDQVKIRGFRVELKEVEATLARHPAVARVAVAAVPDHQGEKQLVAYVVVRADAGDGPVEATLRAYASATMPQFMVPSAFVALDTFPLTHNGKLDHSALPAPGPAGPPDGSRAPRDQDEEILCELFAGLLGRAPAGIDDSFFDLGGNSLRASRLVSRIRARLGAEITLRTVFESPTVAALAACLGDQRARPLPPSGEPVTRPDTVPLSFAQRCLWLLERIGAGSAYVLPVLVRVSGEIDAGALRAAVADVIARHEALRTVFDEVDGEPVQRVVSGEAARTPFTALRAGAQEREDLLARAARQRFDLRSELPVRVLLVTADDDQHDHALLLTLHHIAADGWSLAPLMDDLSRAYAARARGAAPDWPPLPLQYSGYAVRQRSRLGDPSDPGSELTRELGYWAVAAAGLGDALAPLRLPARAAPGPAGEPRADTVTRVLDAAAHGRLTRLAAEYGMTLFMVLQAALAVALFRAGAGRDVAVGGVVAGRDEADLDELVGFFVNLIVLRTDLSGDPTVSELLTRVRESSLTALSHQNVPFELVVQHVNPDRIPGRNPLTDVVLLLQNNTAARLALPGTQSRVTVLRTGAPRFGVLVEAADDYAPDGTPCGVTLTVEYQTDGFERGAIERLASSLLDCLAVMSSDPGARLSLPDVPVPLAAPGRLDPPGR